MKNNIINFNNHKEEGTHICPHCELKGEVIHGFLHQLLGGDGKFDIDHLIACVDEFYDDVYEISKMDAYENMIDFASHNAYGED